jgi:hypothetical protein
MVSVARSGARGNAPWAFFLKSAQPRPFASQTHPQTQKEPPEVAPDGSIASPRGASIGYEPRSSF